MFRSGIAILTSIAFLFAGFPTGAAISEPDHIRTANYFLLSGTTLDDTSIRNTLMKFDLLVLPIDAQLYNQDFFEEAREKNPDIIILAYMPTVSWNYVWTSALYQQMWRDIQSDWWLRNENNNQISIWPNTEALNLTTGWSDYLAEFTTDDVLGSGLWDGVFFDEVSAEISWVGSVDLDDNGQADDAATANEAWKNGLVNLFSKTRAEVGDNTVIVMNGSSHTDLFPYVNGRMYESFPTPWEGSGSWEEITDRYIDQHALVDTPVFIINGNSDNTGVSTNYQDVRYKLTTTLLGNGYFGYDYGTFSHQQTWYYDEYDAYLGSPIEAPQNVLSSGSYNFSLDEVDITPSVWERDFTNGKAVVNSTSQTQTVSLDGDYEKIHGDQDPNINNGRIVSSVELAAKDGIILLRPLEEIVGAVFTNGTFIRIFNGEGNVSRNGFFAYDSEATGGNQVIRYDLDFDGDLELVSANDSQVFIYESDGSLKASFYPYTENYNLGINLAVGDIESDGSVEIVTGTENGGGPQLRIFNGEGVLIHPGFFAYDTAFRGGVNVAIGDLNGDGWNEIIAGAGVGGGPHVRVFNKDGDVINPGFFAYDEGFRGGVNVAVGDVDGDRIDDIVTAPGLGGAPEVRIYTKDGMIKHSGFYALDANSRQGLEISAVDLDGDDIAEILAIGSDVFTLTFE